MKIIDKAELRRRLRRDLAMATEMESSTLLTTMLGVRYAYGRYRRWVEDAIIRLDAGEDPNTIIAEWSKVRGQKRRLREWFWPRQPTDAVVEDR